MVSWRVVFQIVILGILFATTLFAYPVGQVNKNRSRSENGFGFTYALYEGPGTQFVTPLYAPGIFYYVAGFYSDRLHLVSKFGMGPLIDGKTFGDTDSAYIGGLMTYKIQPKWVLVAGESIQPYFSAGPIFGAFALMLTNLAVSKNVSNNQASLKYGITANVGCDFINPDRRGFGAKGFGINVEFFYYLPTPKRLQFQAAKLEARGVEILVSIITGH